MATVPFSEKLKTAIIDSACAPFVVAMTAAANTVRKDYAVLRMLCVIHTNEQETALAEKLHQLRPVWVAKRQLSVTIQEAAPRLHITLEVNEQMFPAAAYDTVNIERKHLKYAPVFSRVDELLMPYRRAVADKEALTKALGIIFDNCASLNAAEKVMPNIVSWCPPDVQAKLRAPNVKAVRNNKTAQEIMDEAFDTDAKAAAARSRIL